MARSCTKLGHLPRSYQRQTYWVRMAGLLLFECTFERIWTRICSCIRCLGRRRSSTCSSGPRLWPCWPRFCHQSSNLKKLCKCDYQFDGFFWWMMHQEASWILFSRRRRQFHLWFWRRRWVDPMNVRMSFSEKNRYWIFPFLRGIWGWEKMDIWLTSLTAVKAYSTWRRFPDGEKIVMAESYPDISFGLF